jgi:two-component system nitrate/nitrite response regulator NarL
MGERTRVVVVDDHPLFREGVAAIIGSEGDMEVVGQGSNADNAIQLAHDLLPDIVLLDIDMPGSGLEAARRIAEVFPVIRIIVLTVSETEENLVSAMKAGARAYVLKGVAGRELLRILRLVLAGESYVPPALAASLLMEMGKPAARAHPSAEGLDELTQREVEILELLSTGLSNKEIGDKLFLTEKTIKHYVTNILQKLQVRNRVEAALLAQKSGWTDDNSRSTT